MKSADLDPGCFFSLHEDNTKNAVAYAKVPMLDNFRLPFLTQSADSGHDLFKISYMYLLLKNSVDPDFLGLSTKIFRILHKLDENSHLNSSCRSQS